MAAAEETALPQENKNNRNENDVQNEIEKEEEKGEQDSATGAAGGVAKPQAWSISFASAKKRVKRSKKEKLALAENRKGEGVRGSPPAEDDPNNTTSDVSTPTPENAAGTTASEAQEKPVAAGSTLPTVNVDALVDPALLIPRNLKTTRRDMEERCYIDNIRLLCMSRPQYKRTCGVSSLTSIWNYLYSYLGHGSLPPVSQEEVMSILGFQPPFGEIRWGKFTGNVTLMRWFHYLNAHFGVKGKAFYQFKLHGQGRTFGLTPEAAREQLKETLRSPHWATIYHCDNHYMVPIGYQDQPRAHTDIYAPKLQNHEVEPYVFVAEVSRGVNPSIHICKWADVVTDIDCQSPNYFNIRHPERGVMKRGSGKVKLTTTATTTEEPFSSTPTPATDEGILQQQSAKESAPNTTTKRKKIKGGGGGNLHCFIGFRSDIVEEDMEQFLSNKKGGVEAGSSSESAAEESLDDGQ